MRQETRITCCVTHYIKIQMFDVRVQCHPVQVSRMLIVSSSVDQY
jgi:hypothetical protein